MAELVLKLALTRIDLMSVTLSAFAAYRDAEGLKDGSGTLSSGLLRARAEESARAFKEEHRITDSTT